MLTGRLLLMLVVMTATLATRQPALAIASEQANVPAERTTWVQRLGTGVARSFSRIGLMQRVALRVPASSQGVITQPARSVVATPPDPLHACLPPPTA